MAAETIPLDDMDPKSLDSGIDFIPVGRYHFGVTSFIPDPPKADTSVAFDCEVLAGAPGGHEGKKKRNYISRLGTGRDADANLAIKKRYLLFAIAVGLTTEDELNTAKSAGRGVAIDWDLAVGRQFCAELVAKKDDATKINFGFGMWPVTSPKAAGIPLNKGMLDKQGEVPANGDPFGGDDQF